MRKQTDERQEILAKIKGWFEAAVTSRVYAAWYEEARTAWDFYDGAQWTREEEDALRENGQAAIVVNKIAGKIDNLAGGEVGGRTRMVYRSRSGDAREEETARTLTDLALYVAERGEQGLEISSAFRAGLVDGIGWLDVGVEDGERGVEIFVRAEDPFSMVWDPLSRRADMADARFVARERWLDEDGVEMLFPEKGAKVAAALKAAGGFGAAAYGMGVAGRGEEVGYYDERGGRFRVVEVQYKQLAKQWRVRLADGRLVATFDKDETKVAGAVVEDTAMVPRVSVAYFAGDVLLDNRPLEFMHNDFTLIPYIYKRHKADGRPYGLVRAAIDPQRELNKRRSKAMHLLNTAQVIADIDAVEDPSTLAKEAARPDGIILKRAGKELRIIRNVELANGQVGVMEQAGRDIQEVLGVFDESLGKQSNAVSGVAIQQRQMAGSLNQMFAFDALRLTKKRMGEQVLALIRQFFSEEMVIRITDSLGAARLVRLNQPVRDAHGNIVRNKDGEPLREPDLSQGQYDVVVEEVKDALSARELDVQRLELLLKAGVPIPPAVLVEASGVSNKEAILAGLGARNQEPGTR